VSEYNPFAGWSPESTDLGKKVFYVGRSSIIKQDWIVIVCASAAAGFLVIEV